MPCSKQLWRNETLNGMSIDDWRLAVYRETQADLWYEEPELGEEPPASTLDIDVGTIRRHGNVALPKVSVAAGSGAA
jgi:hypothetical protein